MNGLRDDHTKSGAERWLPRAVTYMRDPKHDTREPGCETDTDSQTRRADVWLPRDRHRLAAATSGRVAAEGTDRLAAAKGGHVAAEGTDRLADMTSGRVAVEGGWGGWSWGLGLAGVNVYV